MDLQIEFKTKIEGIQQKLRECNHACNRLKEEVELHVPRMLRAQEEANELRAALAALQAQGPPPLMHASPEPEPEIPAESILPPLVAEPLLTTTETPEVVHSQASGSPVAASASTPKRRTVESPARQAARSRRKPQSSAQLENFIGGNLLNKVGIGILVLGIGIFVKYAIDQDWIGPIGRVLIGLLSGGILLGTAHRLHRQYKAFSSVLLGGGMATFYYSVAIGYHYYGLFGQPLAFVSMCVITAATVFFSVQYDRREIAVLGVLGAFSTPFMLYSGEGSYVSLFSYLLIVNIGMAVLAWYRDWSAVRILSYGLTVLIMAGWMANALFEQTLEGVAGPMTFVVLFFLTFFAMHVAFSLRQGEKLGQANALLVLSASGVFYAMGAFFLYNQAGDASYLGIYTALAAAFHLVVLAALRSRLSLHKELKLIMVGLSLSLVTAAVPIQLQGRFMTLFWAAEAVMVLMLAQRTGYALLRRSAVLISLMALISSLWDLSFFEPGSTMFLNGHYFSGLVVAASFVAMYLIYRRYPELGTSLTAAIFRLVAILFFYMRTLLEIGQYVEGDVQAVGAFLTFSAVYLFALNLWALQDKSPGFGKLMRVLGLMYLMAFVMVHIALPVREISHSGNLGLYLANLVGTAALLGLQVLLARENQLQKTSTMGFFQWVMGCSVVFITSVMANLVLTVMGVPGPAIHKAAYPVLWGLIGVVFISLGMRQKAQRLRIMGLSLFLLILIKLFVYDIRAMSAGGQIIAFICLGVLLLVASFLYQKLKSFVTEEELAD